MAEITIKKVVDTADSVYQTLYRKQNKNNKDADILIHVCTQLFEYKMKTAQFKKIVKVCSEYRKDPYISDRECASLILALEKLKVAY